MNGTDIFTSYYKSLEYQLYATLLEQYIITVIIIILSQQIPRPNNLKNLYYIYIISYLPI